MIRVIGVGNPHRKDDAVGIAVVRLLGDRKPANAEVVACDTDPTTLLDRWGEDDRVIVVDAASSRNAPGTIHRFDAVAAPLPAKRGHTTTWGRPCCVAATWRKPSSNSGPLTWRSSVSRTGTAGHDGAACR